MYENLELNKQIHVIWGNWETQKFLHGVPLQHDRIVFVDERIY